MTLSITAVFCTRNRAEPLAAALADVVAQLGASDRVLVVDQSDPEVVARNASAIQALDEARIVHRVDAARGVPQARNLAVARATTPLLWFLDDDVRVMPGALEAMRAVFDDPAVGAAAGRIEERRVRLHAGRPGLTLGWDGRIRQRIVGLRPTAMQVLPGVFAARAVALRGAGPCDAGFGGGSAFLEDVEWSTRIRRAGWALRFVPDATVVHLSAPSGGNRVTSPAVYDRWRVRNTARWLRRHRPWGVAPAAAVFTAIAGRRAWDQRSVDPVVDLVSAFVDGWIDGVAPPVSGRPEDQDPDDAAGSGAGSGSGYR